MSFRDMNDKLDNGWTIKYGKPQKTALKKIPLTKEGKETLLENSIDLLKRIQNDFRTDEKTTCKFLMSGLSQLIFDLESMKNGYVMV